MGIQINSKANYHQEVHPYMELLCILVCTLLSPLPELLCVFLNLMFISLWHQDVLVNTAHTHGLYTFQAQLPVAVMA